MERILKFSSTFKALGDGKLELTASDESLDRDGDIIRADGWDLKNFKKNPVILYAHDYSSLPVARAERVWVKDGKLKSIIDFAPTQDAQDICALYEGGFLNAFSVGFVPLQFKDLPNKDPEKFPGREFTKQELLEISCVPVPSNPSAVQNAMSKGLHVPESIQRLSETYFEKKVDLEEIHVPTEEELEEMFDEEEKGVLAYAKHSLDASGSWDGPAEVAKADVDDLKQMCAWVDSANDDTKGAYKLPHHRADGYTTVWAGVTAAMGALLGARGGVSIPDGDRKGVYNHLSKHYGDFSKTPPDFKEYTNEELDRLFEEAEGDEPEKGEPIADEKSGRVLSQVNFDKVSQARNLLQAALDSAGMQDAADEPEIDEPEESKDLNPEAETKAFNPESLLVPLKEAVPKLVSEMLTAEVRRLQGKVN